MADNTTLNPGVGGDVIASDDIGGVKYQRVKLEYGEDGSATDVSLTNPLPVTSTQLADAVFALVRILNALNAPQGYDKSLQRQRGTVVVESGTVTTVTTVTTVSTVSTVTNLSTIDTLQGRLLVNGANMSAWADTVRSRIT